MSTNKCIISPLVSALIIGNYDCREEATLLDNHTSENQMPTPAQATPIRTPSRSRGGSILGGGASRVVVTSHTATDGTPKKTQTAGSKQSPRDQSKGRYMQPTEAYR